MDCVCGCACTNQLITSTVQYMYACKPYLLCYMDRHIVASVLPCIKVLNFEDNLLAQWSEVKKLAVLPRYAAPVLLVQFGEML